MAVDTATLVLWSVGFALAWSLAVAFRKTAKAPAGTRPIRTLDTTLPVLGNLLDHVKHGHRFHDWLSDNCIQFKGDLWKVTIPGQADVIMVSTPDVVEDITKTHFDNFIKGEYQRDWMHDFLGDGIFTSDGERWVHQRKTASRFFTARVLREYMTKCIQQNAQDVYNVLEKAASTGEVVNLQQLFKEFAIQAFGEMGFGIDLNCIGASEEHPFQAAMDTAVRVLSLRFRRPVWLWKLLRWLNIGAEGELRRSMAIVNEAVYSIARQSLDASREKRMFTDEEQQAHHAKSVLELFLSAVESESMESMQLQDLRDFALVFVLAGRDTTADTFTWFFYMLSEHPDVERKIRDELERALPEFMKDPGSRALKMDDVAHLTYLEAALKETLRLFPLAAFNVREVAVDTLLSNGALVRKGQLMGLSAYAMARNPVVWGDDAACFRPERWIDAATGRLAVVSSYKFLTFHAGPRTCLGQNLALLELKLMVVNLLSRFSFAVLPGNDGSYEMSLTLPMKHPLRARVASRATHSAVHCGTDE